MQPEVSDGGSKLYPNVSSVGSEQIGWLGGPNLVAESRHPAGLAGVVEVAILFVAIPFVATLLQGTLFVRMQMEAGTALNRVNPVVLEEDSASSQSVRKAVLVY